MKLDPNAPAFPALYGQTNGADGLTVRQHFAAMAMQGYLSNSFDYDFEEIAIKSVKHADALIAELNKETI